jgi:spore coat polysaccharide biosynthesis predicted glycosyltransferase SpsG
MLLRNLIGLVFEGIQPGNVVLFRVDAGRKPGLSYGHLMRCGVLASGLREYFRSRCFFAMTTTQDGIKQAHSMGLSLVPLKNSRFELPSGDIFAVVFDLPQGLTDFDYELIPNGSIRTIIIDDAGNTIPIADVILNSSITATSKSYPQNAKLLLGPDYLILPETYEHARKQRHTRPTGTAVLITYGGSDPSGLTVRTLSALSEHKWPVEVYFTIVMGPGFAEKSIVANLAQRLEGQIKVVDNPPDLLPYFSDADLAICAGGRTLYELGALGVPTIAVASIEHEISVVKAFGEKNLILFGFDRWDKDGFIHTLKEVLIRSC